MASPASGRQRPVRSDSQPAEREQSDTCPECNADSLVAVRAEVVCEECGLVVKEEAIDRGPEWRAFDHVERTNRSRVGAPRTQMLHDHGLTTQIGWGNEDVTGRPLSTEKRHRVQRMRTWQERIRTNDSKERNLQLALSEIERMASATGVPDPVREVAATIYRRALDADLIRGRSIEGIATAALYASCRQEGVPRTLDEIVEVSRVSRTETGRAHRYICAELGIDLRPYDPKQFVPKFASALDLDRAVQRRASEIVDAAVEEGLASGKSPAGFAGAALYIAAHIADEKRTQSEVAEAASVTPVTIRNHYQEQVETLGLDVE